MVRMNHFGSTIDANALNSLIGLPQTSGVVEYIAGPSSPLTSSISAISWTLPKIRLTNTLTVSINFHQKLATDLDIQAYPVIDSQLALWCMRILNVWAWDWSFKNNWPSISLWLTSAYSEPRIPPSASWTAIRVTASLLYWAWTGKSLLSMSPSPTAVTGIIWLFAWQKQMTVIRPNCLTTSASALIRLAKILTTSPFLVSRWWK